MLSRQRQEYILNIAQSEGFVSIPKTAELLEISVESVRRDVNSLCQRELLKKVRGGAVPAKSPMVKTGYPTRKTPPTQHSIIAIAREAAQLIRDGNVVCMDGSDFTLEMIPFISKGIQAMYVTNSLNIAIALRDRMNSGEISGSVIVTGGQIIHNSYRSMDIMALEVIDKYFYDIAFVSCAAASATGVSYSATNPSVFAQHIIRRASSSVLLVGSNRLGRSSVRDYAKPTDFDRIITDNLNPCPTDIIDALNGSDTVLTIVDSNRKGGQPK